MPPHEVARAENAVLGHRLGWRLSPSRWLLGAAALVATGFFALRTLGGDEHFYAYAASAVYRGETPYSDFLFPQGPITPYVLGLPSLLGFDALRAGQALSLLFAITAMALAVDAARRLAGERAATVAAATLLASVAFLHTAPTFTPFPLVALLLVASAWALVAPIPWPARALLGGAAIGLAACARLNAGVAVPLLMGVVAVVDRGRIRNALLVGVGAAIPLLLAYGPLILRDPAAAWWNLVGFHTLDGRDPAIGFASQMKYKLDAIGFMARASPFLAATLLFAGALAWQSRGASTPSRATLVAAYAASASVLVLSVNFLKVYFQPGYVVMVVPLLALLAGLAYAAALSRTGDASARRTLAALVGALLVANVVAAAPAEIRGADARSSLTVMEEVGALLDAKLAEDARIFTSQPAFAVAANRNVVDGSELGTGSLFPRMGDAEAASHHVLNAERLRMILRDREADALVLIPGDFVFTPFPSLDLAPGEKQAFVDEMWALVEANYALEMVRGEGDGQIRVYLAR